MRSLILSQCRDLRIGVTREDLGAQTFKFQTIFIILYHCVHNNILH